MALDSRPLNSLWSYFAPHAPKAMILTKQCRGLGKAQLQCQIGKNALGGLVLFYGMQYSLIQKLEFSSSYVVRDSQKPRMKVRLAFIIVLANDPLLEFFSCSPHDSEVSEF